MTDQLVLITNCSDYLSRYFDDEKLHSQKMEELKEKLTEKVVYMLLHEMERLLGILYRIDVSEVEVKKLFAQNDPKQIAPGLVTLIINRELKKTETRVKHKPT